MLAALCKPARRVSAPPQHRQQSPTIMSNAVRSAEHVPVLVEQVVQLLEPMPGQIVVDCTCGLAGHSLALAERLQGQGRLVCLDLDPSCLAIARQRLANYPVQADFVHANFTDVDRVLAELRVQSVDVILADLGVSSSQLDDPERGFSFQTDGQLDMRYDRTAGNAATDIVNSLSERDLADVIFEYGGEKHSRKIAKEICRARRSGRITTTRTLADIVATALRASPASRPGRIHPATRTFQALRIAVNQEVDNLNALLTKAPTLLAPGGRIGVISFHSGEDRPVKTAFQQASRAGIYEILTRKPIRATNQQIQQNPRCRSAKLRVARRKDAPLQTKGSDQNGGKDA